MNRYRRALNLTVYGHNSELTRALDARNLFYILDIHKDEHVYLEEPVIAVPCKQTGRGRAPANLRADRTPISVQSYYKGLKFSDFQTVKVRKTVKGTKTVRVHVVRVWHWDGQESKACMRTLVITVDKKDKRVKFSFSNGTMDEYSAKEYARFQCNRYWVERSFDDGKNEVGLSGYQIRGWKAWHHHVALVMMAQLYLLKRKLRNRKEYPL